MPATHASSTLSHLHTWFSLHTIHMGIMSVVTLLVSLLAVHGLQLVKVMYNLMEPHTLLSVLTAST